jgi:hypothetical protein
VLQRVGADDVSATTEASADFATGDKPRVRYGGGVR